MIFFVVYNLGHFDTYGGETTLNSMSEFPVGLWFWINGTMKPVCNDHLYNKINHLWFIQ